jgi:hypothetical protein
VAARGWDRAELAEWQEEVAARPFSPNCSNCSRTAATTFRAQLIGKSLFYKNNPKTAELQPLQQGCGRVFKNTRLKDVSRVEGEEEELVVVVFY